MTAILIALATVLIALALVLWCMAKGYERQENERHY